MTIKDELYRLIDELPESEWHTARRFLDYLRNMGDPMLQSLMEAPYDDEPTTPEEDEGAREAWQEYTCGVRLSLLKRPSENSCHERWLALRPSAASKA